MYFFNYCLISDGITSLNLETEKLLISHLKLIERNEELIDSKINSRINKIESNNQNDLLDQVLRKNEVLAQELDRIKQENTELKRKLNNITLQS